MSNFQDQSNEAVAALLAVPLTEHEQKVKLLLLSLYGMVQGFPDSELKLNNVTRAWADIVSLEPYHVKFSPQIEPYMSKEDKAKYMWKEGIIPGEWLVKQIRNSCEWFPAPVVAREIYIGGGFPPVDGLGLDQLASVGRKRADGPDIRPADILVKEI